MTHSQYTFSSGARMCLSLAMIVALFGAVAAYLTLGWLCLHLGSVAATVVFDEHMGASLTTITFVLAHVALVLWLSQIGNGMRLSAYLLNKGHRAIHQRSLNSAVA